MPVSTDGYNCSFIHTDEKAADVLQREFLAGWLDLPAIDCTRKGRKQAEYGIHSGGSEDTAPKVGVDEALCGGAPALRFLVLDELGDAHQVVGQHRGANQHLEPLAA